MQSPAVRFFFLVVVLAAAILEGVLLHFAWPLGVLAGVAGAALFALALGVHLQREWDAAAAPQRAATTPEAPVAARADLAA